MQLPYLSHFFLIQELRIEFKDFRPLPIRYSVREGGGHLKGIFYAYMIVLCVLAHFVGGQGKITIFNTNFVFYTGLAIYHDRALLDIVGVLPLN